MWCDCTSQEVDLFDSEKTLCHGKFQSRITDAFEDSSDVVHNCFVSFAALRISSLYWANWPALIALSRYSLMKLENAESYLLRPWQDDDKQMFCLQN